MLDTAAPVRFGVMPTAASPSLAERLDDTPLTASEKQHANRSAKMVRALPKDGAIVIVHSVAAIAPMRDLIRALRGETIANLTRVFAAPKLNDGYALVRGLDLPVIRDAFVEQQREHSRAFAQAWRL